MLSEETTRGTRASVSWKSGLLCSTYLDAPKAKKGCSGPDFFFFPE
jgi:hypothetical protein